MKRVLVTGGAGYVGSGLLRDLLAQGFIVTCIDNLLFGGESLLGILHHKNFTFIKCDLNNKKKIEKILSNNNFEAVIHLAAIVGDPACKLYSDLAKKTNWLSSKWLLDKSIEMGISRFIFASTCSNYGKMQDSEAYVNEFSKLSPVSLYAELKVKFENYLLDGIKKNKSFSPTSLRFATVYGLSPRMRFDLTVNEFTKELAMGKKLVVFGEQFWRPYCHVNDFSKAFIKVLKSPAKKVAYNVFNVGSTKENYTKKMIIEELKSSFPNSQIVFVKKDEDPRDYKVNFDKIKKELGFKIGMTVPDGIKEIKKAILSKIILNPDNQKYYNIPYV